MNLIFRYLAKETCITMVSVTGILVLIFMSHQFVHYLRDAAVGRLTPEAVLQMMCIQVPLLLGFMLPLGFFIGILLAYGRLYVDNEMTVLTACGISKVQLLKMTLGIASIITLLVVILMLWVEPKMALYRDKIIAKAAVSSPIEKVAPGRFQTVGDWVLYTEGISRDRRKMAHVFAAAIPVTATNKPALDVVIAEKAFQKINSIKETFIVLANGYRYQGEPGKQNYQIVQFGEYGIRLPDKSMQLGKLEEFMSFRELWQLSAHNPQAAAELQWRISMPLSVIILTLFAVPLSEVRPRQGRFSQILPAIILYIIYINLLFLGKEWLVKGQLPAAIGMWWIHALMLVVALGILYFKLPLKKANLPK